MADTKKDDEIDTEDLAAQARYVAAITKLTNWSALLAGRLSGIRSARSLDPHSAGYRDLFDRMLILRADCDAISGLMLLKGVCTEAELREAIGMEAERLSDEFTRQYVGFASLPTSNGLDIVDEREAARTMKGWPQ